MQKLMAANWKMYKTPEEALVTTNELLSLLSDNTPEDREVVLFAPFLALSSCYISAARVSSRCLPFQYGAQNFYPAEEGAFTGEISLNMIKASGAHWVLIGHSERRSLFNESDDFLAKKAQYALSRDMKTIFCIGESLDEREKGLLKNVLTRQLKEGLQDIPSTFDPADLAIAYEPVWAIGTGKVAKEEDIKEAHALVRSILNELFGAKANEIRILYGGSVKPENAPAIMAIENVNGVLVGGASLAAASFNSILRA